MNSWRSNPLADKPQKAVVKFTPTEQEASELSDERASKEGIQLGSGKSQRDLQQEADEADHDRDQAFKEHFERIALVALYLGALAVFISAGIWFYHLVAPEAWSRFSDGRLDAIQDFLTGGVIVGLFASHFKKRLE